MNLRKHPRTEIGRQVALAAFLADVELRALAAHLGLHKQSLYYRMTGERRWQPGELSKVADYLGVTEGFLRGAR